MKLLNGITPIPSNTILPTDGEKPEGLLPLWVADMDFKTPAPVVEALVEKSKHGIFGYSEGGQDYFLR